MVCSDADAVWRSVGGVQSFYKVNHLKPLTTKIYENYQNRFLEFFVLFVQNVEVPLEFECEAGNFVCLLSEDNRLVKVPSVALQVYEIHVKLGIPREVNDATPIHHVE